MALSEQKHQLILKAAVVAFTELGFSGATMDDIASRAGVSKRTLYAHFPGKAELFERIAHEAKNSFAQVYAATYDPKIPIQKQLAAIASAEGKLFSSKSFMRTASLLWSESARSAELAARLPKLPEDTTGLAAFMQAAMNAGALRKDDPVRASAHFKDLLKARAFWPGLAEGRAISKAEMRTIERDAVVYFLSHYGAVRGSRRGPK